MHFRQWKRCDFNTLLGRHVASAACCPLCCASVDVGTLRTVNTAIMHRGRAFVASPMADWQATTTVSNVLARALPGGSANRRTRGNFRRER